MAVPAIKIQNLSFRYQNSDTASLKNINIEIPKGSCTLLLGLNGAGKSTLMSLICGLLKVSDAHLSFPAFAGQQAFSSYGTQHLALYGELTVWENMRFFAKLINPQQDPDESLQSLSVALDFKKYLGRRVMHCSGGIKQRVHVAVSLLYSRPLIVLDEPFNNIDPESRDLIRDILKQYLVEKKVTLLLSSHQFDAMEDLWTHLVFLKNGEVSEFLARSSSDRQQKLQSIFLEIKSNPLELR